MKKLTIILILLLSLSLCACGENVVTSINEIPSHYEFDDVADQYDFDEVIDYYDDHYDMYGTLDRYDATEIMIYMRDRNYINDYISACDYDGAIEMFDESFPSWAQYAVLSAFFEDHPDILADIYEAKRDDAQSLYIDLLSIAYDRKFINDAQYDWILEGLTENYGEDHAAYIPPF